MQKSLFFDKKSPNMFYLFVLNLSVTYQQFYYLSSFLWEGPTFVSIFVFDSCI